MLYFDYTSKLILLIVFLLSILLVSLSFAWSPENGIGICTVSGHQTEPQMVSDGTGGAIITWVDGRNTGGTTDIYAQRINIDGQKLWAVDGIPICTASLNQQFSNPNINDAMIADGNGNYIITWQDNRNGNWDIYAQKINSQGSTLWAINGISVCTVSTNQVSPSLVSDGAGGAIIAWQDWRNDNGISSTWRDIYVQRIDNNGIPLWTLGGVSICTAKYTQDAQVLISDENHGAIIAWRDNRYPFIVPVEPWPVHYDASPNAYAQRIDSTGNTLWRNNGICVASSNAELGSQNTPQILPDGNGGAFISCEHPIDAYFGPAVAILLRINSSGSTLWSCSMMTSNSFSDANIPLIVSDGNNGVFIAFDAIFIEGHGVRLGRLNNLGNPIWPINGVSINVCTSYINRWDGIHFISDGIGGAIILWALCNDPSSSPYFYLDFFAQRVNSSGSIVWPLNGITICTTNFITGNRKVVSDMTHGAILVWQDNRNGNWDIYAQRVYGGGYVISPVNVPKELWDFEL